MLKTETPTTPQDLGALFASQLPIGFDDAEMQSLFVDGCKQLHPRRIGLGDHPAECSDTAYMTDYIRLIERMAVKLCSTTSLLTGISPLQNSACDFLLMASNSMLWLIGQLLLQTRQEPWAYRRDYSICWETPATPEQLKGHPTDDARLDNDEEVQASMRRLAAVLSGPSLLDGHVRVTAHDTQLLTNPMYLGIADNVPLLTLEEWRNSATEAFETEYAAALNDVKECQAALAMQMLHFITVLRICIGHGNPAKIGYTTELIALEEPRRYMPSLEANQYLRGIAAGTNIDDEFIFLAPQHIGLVPSRPVNW